MKLIFFRVYTYIHLYPCKRWSPRFLECSDWYLQHKLKPLMKYMHHNLQEIHWDDRLNEYNHTPHFPKYITGCVDTFPIRLEKPTNYRARKLLYNPKYGTTIVKVEMIVDFLGRIISFSGPHLGLR